MRHVAHLRRKRIGYRVLVGERDHLKMKAVVYLQSVVITAASFVSNH
jgi:hypothetical protein